MGNNNSNIVKDLTILLDNYLTEEVLINANKEFCNKNKHFEMLQPGTVIKLCFIIKHNLILSLIFEAILFHKSLKRFVYCSNSNKKSLFAEWHSCCIYRCQ